MRIAPDMDARCAVDVNAKFEEAGVKVRIVAEGEIPPFQIKLK